MPFFILKKILITALKIPSPQKTTSITSKILNLKDIF